MTTTDQDPLSRALGGLSAAAPPDLMDRIAAHWSYVPGPVEDAYVATTDEGIASVMPASSVGGDAGFAAAFRRHFGRPLFPSRRAPVGVQEALRTGIASQLRFDLRGRTSFEQDVLEATLGIPPGEIRPYAWVAEQIGRPRAVRAVGTALGHNPVPLLIPCHRVIRSDGNMGQYGFGTEMKRRLLSGEGVDVDEVATTVRRGSPLIGNRSDRVVCMPTCHRLADVAPEQRRAFRTLPAATAAGFRPCEHCRPNGR